MEKVTDFLEKNVQWVALALGALFVGYMAYAYVLKSPAEVTIDGQSLGSSEVDPYTEEHVAKQLEGAMNASGTLKIEVPKHVDKFMAAMSWKDAPPAVAVANVWNAQTKDVQLPVAPPNPNAPQNPNVPPGPGVVTTVGVQKVAQLPVPPPATPAEHKFGRSVVLPPPAPGQPAPPPPTTPVLPGQAVPGSVDKDWITQLFKLNMGDLDKAFDAVKIPQGFTKTQFLQVVMEREELDSAGNVVPNSLKPIASLGVYRNAGTLPPPYPALNDREQQAAYLAWASANTPDILQPLFYTTVPTQGEQWTKPGEQVQTAQQAFDPLQYLTGQIPTWVTPEQKTLIMQARQVEAKRKADEAKTKRPPPTRSPTRGGGGVEGEPASGGRNYAPAAPVAPRTNPPPPVRPVARPPYPPQPVRGYDPSSMEGDIASGGVGGGGVAPPGLPQPGTDYPNGEFDVKDPAWVNKTIEMWAHDDTIQAGRTYHYRVIYKIRNPLFGGNAGANPDINNQFDIASKPSEWSSPVAIPNLLNFFIQSSPLGGARTVRIEIFRWDKGQQKSETFTVGPGDQVGGVRNGVDYSTEWTVVDFRTDERQGDTQILLVNNKDGAIIARSYKADASDPLYKALKDQVQALKTVAGGPGGAPPVIP